MGYLDSTCKIDIEETGEGFYVMTGEGRTGETWFACGRSLNIAGLIVECCTVGEPITYDDRATVGHRRADVIAEFRTLERDAVRKARASSDCETCYGEGWKYASDDAENSDTVACDCTQCARPGFRGMPTP